VVFKNVYEDDIYSDAYSKLEFPNDYYLAYRDLPEIFSEHVTKTSGKAIDFGCGTGRSTRFLKKHGFDATGVDISKDMLDKARVIDPNGSYQLIKNSDFSNLEKDSYDLIISIFTFDNIPGVDNRANIMKGLKNLLNAEGTMILLDSTPELYVNEWASFSTKDFPQNKLAKSGDKVYDIITDVEDRRPCVDILWTDDDYKICFNTAKLNLVTTHNPLGKAEEPYNWINETKIAPWVIYVLKKTKH